MELLIVPLAMAFVAIGFGLGFGVGRARRGLAENRGEAAVRRALSHLMPARGWHLLNNVTIPHRDGTTQIDHILVSPSGVFVIEAKHYTGWLFGDASSQQWTQVIYRVKNRFQNPIHQNDLHVRAIRGLLDFLPPENVHSLVVFTGDAEFKTPIPQGVIRISDLARYPAFYGPSVITPNRVQFVVGRLECTRRAMTRLTDFEHHAYLERKHGPAI